LGTSIFAGAAAAALLAVIVPLGGCSSSSSADAGDCCNVPGPSAFVPLLCYCGSGTAPSGAAYSVSVSGSTCTITAVVDGGTDRTTVQGTTPNASTPCKDPYPDGG
jgi:hypothetical protein